MTIKRPNRRDVLKYSAAIPALTLSATDITALESPEQSQPGGYFRFTMGDAKLTIISDGFFESSVTTAGVNADPADVQAFLIRHFQNTEKIYRHTNHIIIELGDAVVLVDVGSGVRFVKTTGRMMENLEAAGFSQEDITHVVLTHAHPDHIWGIRDDFDEAIFPDAKYLIGRFEHDWWMREGRVDEVPDDMIGMVVGARNSLLAIETQLERVDDGHQVAPGITMLDTPGHTLGHMSLRIESAGEQLLVLGDAARDAFLSFEQPNWVGAVDMDPDQTVQTRHSLLDMAATDNIAVLGYHFPFPGVGHVMKQGQDTYRFIPTVYRWRG